MTVNRTTWLWPLFAAVLILGLMGITPSQAQDAIASRVVASGLNPSSLARPSSLVKTSTRIKGTPVPAPFSATLVGKQSHHSGMGSASPAGSQDEPYTNYRFADHYLR